MYSEFFGIRVVANPSIPEGEVWLLPSDLFEYPNLLCDRESLIKFFERMAKSKRVALVRNIGDP